MSRMLLGISLLSLGLSISTLAQVAHQHHPPLSANEYVRVLEDPGRDSWQQPEKVVAKLGLRPGDSVADIGAGSGYFTVRLARSVGPKGKVFAVDIDPALLTYIERRAKKEHLQNIQTVLAGPHDPKLAPRSVDLIFICDTLHHISERGEYYPRLARALKPGGRLADVDFYRQRLPIGPPVEMKIARSAVIDEVKPAGFHLAEEYKFLRYQYFLIFKR
jgi:arsenite methyltransferase